MHLLSLNFYILGDLKTNLDYRRRESLEHQCTHACIDRPCANRLASWCPERGGHLIASVTRFPAVIMVAGEHPPTTKAA